MTLTPGLNPLFLAPPALSLAVGLFLAGLALVKGGGRTEPRLFALVCLWMSILCLAFISHFLVSDPDRLLTVERIIHFFYVYFPAVTLVFFLRVLNAPHPRLVATSFTLSFLISLTTPTDLYFTGHYHYSWGMIARGGPAFHLFGIYSFGVLGYSFSCFYRRLRSESNPVLRLKFTYILISFGLSCTLILLNIPAINGIDFYPLGNLSFIPLAIMAYGVLKHRLLDIRHMVHNTLGWLAVSSLVLLPNAGIFLGLQTALREWPLGINFVILTLWFVLNLLYFRKIQPVINRAFNRSRNSLVQRRMAFLEEISLLKNLDELSAALTRALSNGLGVDRVAFYIRRHQDRRLYQQTDGTTLNLTPSLERYLVHGGHLIERDRLETFVPKRREVQAVRSLFERTQAAYLIPMVQEHQLLAVALLSEKTDGLPLNSQESYFIREIKASGTIALFNSILYQNVTDLRDRLQQRKITLQQEIRDREKVQQALQNSERQYRLLAENILDVIWIINLDRNAFAYISPSVTHLTGYDPQEAVKLPLNQVMTEASLARMRQEMRTRGGPLAGGEPRPFWIMNTEVELIRKDGSTVWVEISASPLKDRGIAYNAILGITRDITDRRQRMEMQHAKVAAEKASQAKSEFLANMSHELRTPLNHIIGFTELVVDQHFGTLNETQADYLNDVLQSSHHLLELINDILDLSKVEAGKMALQKEALELAPLLENGLGMIKEKSLRHNIRLKLDIQDAPAIIQADQRKIKQILYNLLSNAVKFTPDGGEICLSATQNPGANGSGSFLEVSVRDTGIGIAAADLERIFNTFEQVENSAARHYEGTGLGLALTRRLVKLHGGRIRAESEGHDRGSRFVVALPVEESRQPACDH